MNSIFWNWKNEETITEQAARLMEQATTRNKYQALLNPMTPQELRISRAFNNELAAHHDWAEKSKHSKHSNSNFGDRLQQKAFYYQHRPLDGYYKIYAYVSGKEITPPFADKIFRTYSEENNMAMKEYCVGLCMGMYCKYKHPSIEIVWHNYGVEKIIATFNR